VNTGGGTSQTGGASPAVVPFSLNPGVAMGNVILDHNLKPAKWLCDTTIKCLFADPKDKFDLSQKGVPVFLTKTALRLSLVGCSILWALSQARNICQCHAEYSLVQLRQLPTLELQQDWLRTMILLLQCCGTPSLPLLLL
jgi:hypothetical protein